MRKYLLISILSALIVAGCDSDPLTYPTPSSPGLGASKSYQPTEDTYTVLLRVMSDPATHIHDANRYEESLTEQLGWKGVFVIHKEGRSDVYQGKFRTAKHAARTLKAAKAYRAQNNLPVFARAMIVPLPGKDIGPPEWKLTSAAGTHSMLVAVFRDVPEKNYLGRRRKAVDYCRRLRKNGVEGYFWHGDVSSHVTIGSFTSRAVRRQRTDPRVLQIQRDFPMLAINGLGENVITRDLRTGKIIRTPRRARLVKIPRDETPDDGAAPDRVGLTQRR